MKITNIEAFPVDGTHVFVVVDTDEGISGVGESGLSLHELAVVGAVEHFKPWLIGQDASQVERIWQGLFRGRFFPGGPVVCSALSAVDIALWDIQGKALGVPVYRLLGGPVRERVLCYTGVGMHGYDTASLVDACQRAVDEGWKALRWTLQYEDDTLEPRIAVREAVKQIEAVRRAVGDDVEICYDVHTRLDLPDAIRLCREVAPFRPFFMEDPLRAENPHVYRALRDHVDVPLAAGEQYATKWAFRELIEGDLIDYARVDLCIVGGISEARKIAGWAEAHYIKMAPHNPLGPVATAASLHLDLATDNFGIQEQHGIPGESWQDVFPVQMPWRDGYLLPPSGPGLGIAFDREAARKRAFKMNKGQYMLRRTDGSLTNV